MCVCVHAHVCRVNTHSGGRKTFQGGKKEKINEWRFKDILGPGRGTF